MDRATDHDEDGDSDGTRRLTRRGALAAVFASVGWSAYSAGKASASTGNGPLEAGRGSFNSVRVPGQSSNPTPSSGYAAIVFRKDRV